MPGMTLGAVDAVPVGRGDHGDGFIAVYNGIVGVFVHDAWYSSGSLRSESEASGSVSSEIPRSHALAGSRASTVFAPFAPHLQCLQGDRPLGRIRRSVTIRYCIYHASAGDLKGRR